MKGALAVNNNEIIFSSCGLEVVGERVCIPVREEIAKQAKAGFFHCGAWYIPERAATLKRYDEHGAPIYSAQARIPA